MRLSIYVLFCAETGTQGQQQTTPDALSDRRAGRDRSQIGGADNQRGAREPLGTRPSRADIPLHFFTLCVTVPVLVSCVSVGP
jgi:hypothetical protein